MCTNPRTILVNDYTGTHSIQVPCGKCHECLKTKQNDYMVRIYEEMMQVPKCCFVTLTYAPENVPYITRVGKKYLTVWKDDVKAWIKRLRTNYERATGIKGIRYFLCSEYGPKTHRPHYHAIFFNMSFRDLRPALDDWRERFGYYMAKDVDYRKPIEKVARYVSKYACKGVFEDPFVVRLNLPKSFRLFSKGLGVTYISRMRAFHMYSTCPPGMIHQKVSVLKGLCHYAVTYLDEVLKRKYVQVNGYYYHMPRYYADKIFKKEIPLGIVDGSKKKIMVKTSLSVALANRAWLLRCERDNAARIANSMDGHSGFEKTALSEAISLLERDSKAKQSLFRFYQFARV